MNILLLAPQPFYQDRGTPIAVSLVLKVLSERGDNVDMITYHEGKELQFDHVTVHRIRNIPLIHDLRPGFSWKKLVCDFLVFTKAMHFAYTKRYQLIHAVEESVFMALVLKWLFKIPYIYDMDSSLSQQMVERYPLLSYFTSLLDFFEKVAVKNAKAVVPVCDALARLIEKHHPGKVVILQDVSLLPDQTQKSI